MIIITVYMGEHGHVEWTQRGANAEPTEREEWATNEDVVCFKLKVEARAVYGVHVTQVED